MRYLMITGDENAIAFRKGRQLFFSQKVVHDSKSG